MIPLVYWSDTGYAYLNLGGDSVNLHAAAEAAVALAETVECVRGKYLEAARRRADTALYRRFGLDF